MCRASRRAESTPEVTVIRSQPDLLVRFSRLRRPAAVLKAWLKETSSGFIPYFFFSSQTW
jgi:hypothetical protein